MHITKLNLGFSCCIAPVGEMQCFRDWLYSAITRVSLSFFSFCLPYFTNPPLVPPFLYTTETSLCSLFLSFSLSLSRSLLSATFLVIDSFYFFYLSGSCVDIMYMCHAYIRNIYIYIYFAFFVFCIFFIFDL